MDKYVGIDLHSNNSVPANPEDTFMEVVKQGICRFLAGFFDLCDPSGALPRAYARGAAARYNARRISSFLPHV